MAYYVTQQIGVTNVLIPPTTITSATWTALPQPLVTYYQLIFEEINASSATIIDVFGSTSSTGANYHSLLRADTLAEMKTITLDVGTVRIGTGNYSKSIVVARGPSMYIYIQESTAPAAETEDTDYWYKLGALA